MELYAHQKRFLAVNPTKALLAWEMGTGKTRTAIEWATQNNYQTLVIAPKGLVAQWKGQVGSNLTIISKEAFKTQIQPKYDALIVDEADHFFSAGFKSQLSKALRAYIKEHDPALLLLTGTPYRSSAWNIYVAAAFLGYKWNYKRFEEAFFFHIRMGNRIITQPRKDKKTADRLKTLIRKIADIVTLEECADIPEQVDEFLMLELTSQQEHKIKHNPEIVPIARFTANHRIESGGNKLERILRILEEERKIIVVCRYISQMDEFEKSFSNFPIEVFRIDGATVNRPLQLMGFNTQSEIPQVLLVQADLCEGYEAATCSTMVFASMSFSYRSYIQMRGRILRLNALHKNKYVHLIAGDADKAIMAAISVGKDFDVHQV